MDPTPCLHPARVGDRASPRVTPRGGVTEASFIFSGGESGKNEEVGEALRAYKSAVTPHTILIFAPHRLPRNPQIPAMVQGKRGGGRTRSSSTVTGSGLAPRGRASCGRGGRGGRGSAASTSRNTAHTGVAAFEFVVDLHCRPYSRMYLPDSFAMANRRPEGF